MSRSMHLSRGKIWFVDIGPCKRLDIFQLCQNDNFYGDCSTYSRFMMIFYISQGPALTWESASHESWSSNGLSKTTWKLSSGFAQFWWNMLIMMTPPAHSQTAVRSRFSLGGRSGEGGSASFVYLFIVQQFFFFVHSLFDQILILIIMMIMSYMIITAMPWETGKGSQVFHLEKEHNKEFKRSRLALKKKVYNTWSIPSIMMPTIR